MARLERLSTMIEGMPCVVLVNGIPKNCPVHEKENKKYVSLCGKRLTEKDLPFGIEVEI